MTGTEPTPQTEQGNGQAEFEARLAQARAEALGVVGPALAGIEQVEIRLGVPLIGNKEIRSEADLPPGVVLASASTEQEMREAERVITDKEAERFYTDMAEHGIGRERDITLAEAGLPVDALNEVEGGLLHTKMTALKQMVLEQRPRTAVGSGEVEATSDAPKIPGDIVQLASKHRKVKPDSPEHEAAARLVDENQEVIARNAALFQFLEVDPRNPRTEWDAAVILWLSDPDFRLAEAPRIIGMVKVRRMAGVFQGRLSRLVPYMGGACFYSRFLAYPSCIRQPVNLCCTLTLIGHSMCNQNLLSVLRRMRRFLALNQ
jgi:hypothetical protein